MKMQHSKNSLYGILSALMLLNVALLFPSSANAQYQSKLPKCDGLNSNKWDMCYGEETSRNGVSYKGEYKDGYRHGFGIITYGNNEKYVGQFAQGRSEGRGTLFGADGRKLKEGAWENNEFVEVSSAELEERRRKAELEKLQNDLAAAKKAQLDAERGKAEAEQARRQAEANANAAKLRADSEQQRLAEAEKKRKAELDKQQLDLAAAKKAQLEAERGRGNERLPQPSSNAKLTQKFLLEQDLDQLMHCSTEFVLKYAALQIALIPVNPPSEKFAPLLAKEAAAMLRAGQDVAINQLGWTDKDISKLISPIIESVKNEKFAENTIQYMNSKNSNAYQMAFEAMGARITNCRSFVNENTTIGPLYKKYLSQ